MAAAWHLWQSSCKGWGLPHCIAVFDCLWQALPILLLKRWKQLLQQQPLLQPRQLPVAAVAAADGLLPVPAAAAAGGLLHPHVPRRHCRIARHTAAGCPQGTCRRGRNIQGKCVECAATVISISYCCACASAAVCSPFVADIFTRAVQADIQHSCNCCTYVGISTASDSSSSLACAATNCWAAGQSADSNGTRCSSCSTADTAACRRSCGGKSNTSCKHAERVEKLWDPY